MAESELGRLGPLPALVSGSGPPLVMLSGLWPAAGVSSARRAHEQALAPYTTRRTVHYVNRRPGLPAGMTFAQLAAEHAAAIGEQFGGEAVDVLGLSTGGSIAQQLAADHPAVVRRLALLSTGCRLGAEVKADMRRVAARVRAGAPRRALAVAGAALAPRPWRPLAAGLAAVLGPLWLHDSDLADLATTIEAEDTFDLARCRRAIAAPTLLVAGDRDFGYPPALLRETAALIPDGRLWLVPEHGHMSVTGLPAVHSALLDHLDDR